MKRFIVSALLTVSLVFSLNPNASAATTSEAGKYVESLGTQTIIVIANKKLGKPQKQAGLEKIFSDNVDIPWVGRFVMGRFWKQASPEQQTRYLTEYRKFIITHYASRFAEYSGGKFIISNSRNDGENEFTVSMQLITGDGSAEPVLIDYRVRDDKGGFKIFDVIVEGVSLITTQRSEFNAILSNKGIDQLISKLANKSIAPKADEKKS